MENTNYITAACTIAPNTAIINNSVYLTDEPGTAFNDFLKTLYKHGQIAYPKYYKMDSLCKLAFLTSELLLQNNPITKKYQPEEIAIVVSNSASSLEVDTAHQATITDAENYFPSPSLFVYTLPNILVGEIAIRNCIKGENTFFIFDKFDAEFMSGYVNLLLNDNKCQCCIAGWVEYFESNCYACLYVVEKQPQATSIAHTKENLNTLIK